MKTPDPPFIESVAARLPSEIRGQRIVVAVSGGADSVALVRTLIALRDEWRLDVHVAHFNHGLRGAAQDDAAWLESRCSEWGVPFHYARGDVVNLAADSNETIEEAARKARYRFLHDVADETYCRWIAVAHTADDQAETILHHILRGTGISGLQGMPRCRPLRGDESPTLLRPLLPVTRSEVEVFLEQHGQEYRIDETNRDERFTRNRIRHQLLPQLRRDFHPEIDAALLRLGQQAAEVNDVMESLAARLLDESLETTDSLACRMNVDRLNTEPRHLVRECFRLLWKRMDWPRQRMGFDQWDRLAELVGTTATESLPGFIRAERRGSLLVLRKEPDRA